MPNVYLLTKGHGPPEELSADSYQREGDDGVFTLLPGTRSPGYRSKTS
jgi:hypothetical protein